jgi:hypothetical protein
MLQPESGLSVVWQVSFSRIGKCAKCGAKNSSGPHGRQRRERRRAARWRTTREKERKADCCGLTRRMNGAAPTTFHRRAIAVFQGSLPAVVVIASALRLRDGSIDCRDSAAAASATTTTPLAMSSLSAVASTGSGSKRPCAPTRWASCPHQHIDRLRCTLSPPLWLASRLPRRCAGSHLALRAGHFPGLYCP